MPSKAQVLKLSRSLNTVSGKARADFARFWSRLDKTDLVAAREALEKFYPAMIDKWGDIAGLVAVEWYEETYALNAVLAQLPAPEQVNTNLRWALTEAFKGDLVQAERTVGLVTDRFVKNVGRKSVRRSADRNKQRWARVPAGRETCGWCFMLASRGYVYGSERKARGIEAFHANCDCQIVPDDGVRPEGYDPDEMYEIYKSVHQGGDTDWQVAKKLEQTFDFIKKH